MPSNRLLPYARAHGALRRLHAIDRPGLRCGVAGSASALFTPPVCAQTALPGASGLTGLVLLLALIVMTAVWMRLRLRARRDLQRALHEGRLAQQSLRELLDNAPAAIWRTDRQGRLVFANRRICEGLALTEDALRSLPRFYDAFDAEAAERMSARDAEALASGEPVFGHEARRDAHGQLRYFDLVKVRVLDGRGRAEGVISIATEVTGQRVAEAQLQQRIAVERELLQVSRGLVAAEATAVDAAIHRALALVGSFAGADRSYLFLLREGGLRADNTHEWCAPGVTPQIEWLQDSDIDGAWPWAAAQLRQGRRVEVTDRDALPAAAAVDQASMAAQDIRGIALLPLHSGGQWVAFIGLDSTRPRARWSEAEISLLQVVGELLSQALLRTRAERDGRAALDQLQAVFEALPDLVFVLDSAGRLQALRGGEAEMLLRPSSEALGRPLEEILPAELAAQLRPHLRSVSESGRPMRFDYVLEQDSAQSEFELRMVRLGADGVLCIARDISARKRFERALAESEQRFRLLLEALPTIAVQGYDAELRVTFWNVGSERLYGYARERALGQRLTELIIPAEFRALVEERAGAWFAGAEVAAPEELRLVRADGAEVVVLSSHALQCKADGSRELFCLDIDLGPLRQAEEQLQLAASVFTHTQEGVVITDPEGRIVEVNRAFSDITGYPREEVLGRTPAFLKSGRHDQSLYIGMWKALIEHGHWAGEVWNRRRSGEAYAEYLKINAVRDAAGAVVHYVGLFADITAQKNYQQHLERIAHFDALTGLPNRVLMADRLRQAMAQARRQQLRVAVAYIDLDGFKAINDAHGHDVGDRFLCAVGERMRRELREGDTVARIGGDEFVVLLVNLPPGDAPHELSTRLLHAASEPVEVGSLQLTAGASIGVSLYPQELELEAEQLLRQADQAMYEAKHGGKGHIRYFDAALDAINRGRQQRLERLRQALEAGELCLHYQPRVDLQAGSVLGVEALMRWRHPERGLLAPAAFLAEAEGESIGLALGDWALRQALSDLSAWRRQGLELSVSVNIAPRHLLSAGFFDRLQAAVAELHGPLRGALTLEVLESSLLDDVERATHVMAQCRELGVEFALDDFGTGYSSLSYLKHLPVNELKIDRSFVRDMLSDPEDLAIIQGIAALARAFQLRLVAEGVETEAHVRALLQLGCVQAQGYGIARPMPASELVGWRADWRPQPDWAEIPELPPGGQAALLVLASYRGWLQRLDTWLSGERGMAPPARPSRGLGRWLAELPDELREGVIAREVWRRYQGLHQGFDAVVGLHAREGPVAARQQRDPLLRAGHAFIEGLEQLAVALAGTTRSGSTRAPFD